MFLKSNDFLFSIDLLARPFLRPFYSIRKNVSENKT